MPSCTFATCANCVEPDWPADDPIACKEGTDTIGPKVQPNQFAPSYVQYWVGGYSNYGEFDANAVSADMNINEANIAEDMM